MAFNPFRGVSAGFVGAFTTDIDYFSLFLELVKGKDRKFRKIVENIFTDFSVNGFVPNKAG